MANQEVKKKLKVPNSELPPISSITEGYSLRYRIVSSDRNRISHWSPIYLIEPEYTFGLGNINFSKSGNIANIVWDAVDIKIVSGINTYLIRKAHEYDLWVRWDRGSGDGDWIYKGRIDTSSLSLPIPTEWTINGVVQGTAPNRLSVEVYLKGNPPERANGAVGTPFLKVYILTNETV